MGVGKKLPEENSSLQSLHYVHCESAVEHSSFQIDLVKGTFFPGPALRKGWPVLSPHGSLTYHPQSRATANAQSREQGQQAEHCAERSWVATRHTETLLPWKPLSNKVTNSLGSKRAMAQ